MLYNIDFSKLKSEEANRNKPFKEIFWKMKIKYILKEINKSHITLNNKFMKNHLKFNKKLK